jgi:hypothetical protein
VIEQFVGDRNARTDRKMIEGSNAVQVGGLKFEGCFC